MCEQPHHNENPPSLSSYFTTVFVNLLATTTASPTLDKDAQDSQTSYDGIATRPDPQKKSVARSKAIKKLKPRVGLEPTTVRSGRLWDKSRKLYRLSQRGDVQRLRQHFIISDKTSRAEAKFSKYLVRAAQSTMHAPTILLPHDRSSLVSHFQLVLESFKGCSPSHTRSNMLSGRKIENSNFCATFVYTSVIGHTRAQARPQNTDLSINHSSHQNPPSTSRRTQRTTMIVKQ